MIKIYLFLAITAALTAPSLADDFNFTGQHAINFTDMGWSPGGPVYLGGPAGNDTSGFASQFIVDQDLSISDLIVTGNVFGRTSNQPTDITYSLYDRSTNLFRGETIDQPMPAGSPIFTGPVDATFDASQTVDIPFSYRLTPGTYWLAEEGQGGAELYTQTSYIDPPSAAVPEPSPFWLLLIGLGLFQCTKKYTMPQSNPLMGATQLLL